MEFFKNTFLRKVLLKNRIAKVLEILIVFIVATLIVSITQIFAGDDPILRQSIVWLANITMLFLVWLGLKIRGQTFKSLGLKFTTSKLKLILLSFVVFFAAIVGFMLGSIVIANITGIPSAADMSGYNYMEGNLPMLVFALVAVFIASSFGEEVIYRGFLITRISEIGNNSKIWSWSAVLVSSIIFGLVHFDWGLMGIGQTFFMGLALGISYIKLNRNLWILVFAHAYMDAILMVQMYLGL
ncbi:MAG: CPBP family intramembrane metalloprotease [Caldithrix sp.]|nr:CPBP family intramembrane metalloprotease [Caldithrix sp.]